MSCYSQNSQWPFAHQLCQRSCRERSMYVGEEQPFRQEFNVQSGLYGWSDGVGEEKHNGGRSRCQSKEYLQHNGAATVPRVREVSPRPRDERSALTVSLPPVLSSFLVEDWVDAHSIFSSELSLRDGAKLVASSYWRQASLAFLHLTWSSEVIITVIAGSAGNLWCWRHASSAGGLVGWFGCNLSMVFVSLAWLWFGCFPHPGELDGRWT